MLLQAAPNRLGPIEMLIISGVLILLLVVIARKRRSNKISLSDSNQKKKDSHLSNNALRVKGFKETEISYQLDGSESRTIDNSKGNGIVRRKLIISREWSKTIDVSEKSTTDQKIAGGLALNFVELKSSLNKALEQRYNISTTDIKRFSEEVEIEIMPFSKIHLNIEWKKIWQNGIAELIDQDGKTILLPYKISKGITFDQSQEKVN